jgi:hypothetical protein
LFSIEPLSTSAEVKKGITDSSFGGVAGTRPLLRATVIEAIAFSEISSTTSSVADFDISGIVVIESASSEVLATSTKAKR